MFGALLLSFKNTTSAAQSKLRVASMDNSENQVRFDFYISCLLVCAFGALANTL